MSESQRRFEDSELMALYEQGKSDSEIARILKVARSAIKQRRDKLELPSHYPARSRPRTKGSSASKVKAKVIYESPPTTVSAGPAITQTERSKRINLLKMLNQRGIAKALARGQDLDSEIGDEYGE